MHRRIRWVAAGALSVSALALTVGTAGANNEGSGAAPHRSGPVPALRAPAQTFLSGGPLTSAALAPTSNETVDIAGPVNSTANPPSSATTVSGFATTSTFNSVAGSAISPDGSDALVATNTASVAVVKDPLTSPTLETSVDISQFTGEGEQTYGAYSDGVAITPDGQAGLSSADSQGAIALTHAGGHWAVDASVHSPGLNQAGNPHQPGWIDAPTTGTPTTTANATIYNGVAISQTTGADGHYVGLIRSGESSTIAVITGVGASSAAVAGTLTDTTNLLHFADRGNGAMAFSPTTADRAVVATTTGFGVLDLSNPALPILGSITAVPSTPGTTTGPQSVAVAPDGDHVVVAVGNALRFYGGLGTVAANASLTQSAAPLTLPGDAASIAFTASGNLVVNYVSTLTPTATGPTYSSGKGSLVLVTGSTTPGPTMGHPLALSGPPNNTNGMSVLPEVAAINRGYYEVASDGGLFAFGDATFYGSMGGSPLNKPVVGMTTTRDHEGYYEVASDGGLFAFGDATFYGSMGGKPLNQPVVGMATTPDGNGYWEVASDGGLFAFGDATFYGSMGGSPLNKPVVGIATTPDGKGYWEVASDGGLFAFGDATFYGSMGGKPLNKPVVGIAATADGKGYWEVASDGGLFAFGDAAFYGSMGGSPLNQPVVGIAATANGGGYWEVASDGGLFAFGDATFYGSMGGKPLNKPVVGIAAS